jgi:hypothetical protein
MQTIGGCLLILGLLALAGGIYKKLLAKKIMKAPLVKSGDAASRADSVAGPRGEISVQGMGVCAAPLRSPVSGTECVYYEYTVKESWDEKIFNEESQKEESKHFEETLFEHTDAANFSVDDGSGPVPIVAGKGGDFELAKTFGQSQGGGLGMVKEFVSGLKDIIKGGNPTLVFGNVRIVSASVDAFSTERVLEIYEGDTLVKTYRGGKDISTKMTVEERVLKTSQRLYVCGKVVEGGRIGSSGWSSLLISLKTRDELLGSTVKFMKELLIGGAAATEVGLLMYKPFWGIAPPVVGVGAYFAARKFPAQINAAVDKIMSLSSRIGKTSKATAKA